jgi:MiaB-like tRNA modifying enzyme
MKKSKVFIKTFGCRTNIYDSMVIESHLKDFDITRDEDSADFVIVNSCTVTNSADSSIRNYINRQNRYGKRVILGGCGAFSKGEELFEQNRIFGLFGHSEKQNINSLLKSKDRFSALGDLNSLNYDIVTNVDSKTKAFIKIQEGCDFECSYCIIPSVRGRARSYPEIDILDQITTLAQNGFGEFVLTGTNIGSYGRDTDSSIALLLKKISQINGVKRVRLGSLEPSQIDDEFKEILGESWLEKHLHIALQHTSHKMLRIMRRRNILKDNIKLFDLVASYGYSLGSDFIVGHPGESKEIWQEAVKNFKNFALTHIHVFQFSPREGTHSATLKLDVRGDEAKDRAVQIEEIVAKNNYNFRLKNSKDLLILVEDYKDNYFLGYDQYFNKIKLSSTMDLINSWVAVDEARIEKNINYGTI